MAHTAPTVQQLKLRYPAFVRVEDAVVDYWLTDAARFVDTSWPEADFGPARMAIAAHHMARQGLAEGDAAIPAGVTSFRSGAFSAQLTEKAANQSLSEGWDSSVYGREYRQLYRRVKGGPRLIA